jgi:hypothetical protein
LITVSNNPIFIATSTVPVNSQAVKNVTTVAMTRQLAAFNMLRE